MQVLVNDHPAELERALQCGPIRWRSPLRDDQFAEYWDASFLERLGAPELVPVMSRFWPRSGPRWDALGVNKAGALVLVEAKAHVRELGSAVKASPRSLARIQEAFAMVAGGWRVSVTPSWTSGYYQYANRLAHAYVLNEVGARPTFLVFLHIIGDEAMGGPRSREEWEQAIEAVHRGLGVAGRLPPYVVDAFISVSDGKPVAA